MLSTRDTCVQADGNKPADHQKEMLMKQISPWLSLHLPAGPIDDEPFPPPISESKLQ